MRTCILRNDIRLYPLYPVSWNRSWNARSPERRASWTSVSVVSIHASEKNNEFVDRDFPDAGYSIYNGYKNIHMCLTYAYEFTFDVSER